MAAEDIGALVVRIESNMTNFNNGLESVNNKVNGLGSTLKKVGGLIAGAFAVRAVINFTKEAVEGAMAAEKAQARLESIAKTVTKATDEQITSLKALAREQQNHSTYADDVIMAGQSQLLSFGMQTESVEKLTSSLADLLAANNGMEASQEDAIGASNLLGKAFMGQAGALSRVGILLNDQQAELLKTGDEMTKVNTLVEIMNQNYGGLAKEFSMTTEGSIIAMNHAWGEVKDMLGEVILPVLGKLALWFSSKLPAIRDFVGTAFEKIGAFIKPIYETVVPLLQAAFGRAYDTFLFFTTGLGNMLDLGTLGTLRLRSAFARFGEVIKNLYETIMPPLQRIFEIFINDILPKLIGAYMKFITNVFPLLIDAFDFIVTAVLPPVIDIIEYLATEIIPLLAAKIQEWLPLIVDIFKGAWDTIKVILDLLIKAFEFAWPNIKDFVLTAVTTIGGIISGLLKTLKGITEFIAGVFTGDWRRAWNGVKTIFSGIWDTIKSVLKGAINFIINGINTFIRGINKIKVPSWVLGIGGKGINIPIIPKLAKGTNFVPHDMLAYLHKGEAVVPQEYNPAAGGSTQHHTFDPIRIEGVNNNGEFIAAVEVVLTALDDKRVQRKLNIVGEKQRRDSVRGLGIA